MAIRSRKVKNKRNADGTLSGKAGVVYDVNLKYDSNDGKKTYNKKGFLTGKDARQHEAEIRSKLINPSFVPVSQAKITVKEFLETWIETHGKTNLRPSTYDSYRQIIKSHITPSIGYVQLRKLIPAMLDAMYEKMYASGLAQNTVRNTHRVLGVALEAARKYGLIEKNPAYDVIAKFGKLAKTPSPYTIEQLRILMDHVAGTEWEIIIMLAAMYAMRVSEILGLRMRNVHLDTNTFDVCEQLPRNVIPGTSQIDDMAPTKSNNRELPITAMARPYFERQIAIQTQRMNEGGEYYFNQLLVSKPNGSPYRRENVSKEFGRLIRRLSLPHIRFHDLRHSAATNMHQLTGDFYTVGEILGHTLKGIGITLGISMNFDATTAQYVDVRMDRKKTVLDVYHNTLHTKN